MIADIDAAFDDLFDYGVGDPIQNADALRIAARFTGVPIGRLSLKTARMLIGLMQTSNDFPYAVGRNRAAIRAFKKAVFEELRWYFEAFTKWLSGIIR